MKEFMDHWQPLLNLISLVEPPHLKKALQEWVNKNQNCAYSVKTGSCDMSCESCLNDITIEHIGGKNEKNLSKLQKPRRKNHRD